jgi:hypothetical protein
MNRLGRHRGRAKSRSPVQSATRHVVETTAYGDIELAAGDTVNCMLG